MENKNLILETLQMQPLSEEEKASRHILGRLYGPIATCKESTRNGRKYNKQLWENALKDEVFNEKVANKSLFLELGHPADREETDMRQTCACIPELPKIVNDDLYAYVDILDTPNGQILKTLIDYGFVPGISSRGSGDIMANDEVDPETFFLETWDIVQLPAVKKARLMVCESLSNGGKTLKTALTESLNKANAKDKEIMKESLDNLGISLDNSTELKEEAIDWAKVPVEEIPTVDDNFDPVVENATELVEETKEDEKVEDKVEEPVEEIKEEPVEDTAEDGILSVKELADELIGFGEDRVVEFASINIDGKEYIAQGLAFNNTKDGVLGLSFDYIPAEESNIENEQPEEVIPEGTDEEADSIEDEVKEVEEKSEEAEDSGDEEVLESLKDMIRQKDMLAEQVKSLESAKTVSDAKVESLTQSLKDYQVSLKQAIDEAAKSKEFENTVQELHEQLTQKDVEIKDLQSKVADKVKLTESVNASASQIKLLKENLDATSKDLEDAENKLAEQSATHKAEMAKQAKLVEAYKAKFDKVMESYIAQKASMLGVKPAAITSRLTESTIEEVEKVCDEMLDINTNMGNLPINLGNHTRIRMTESQSAKTPVDPQYGYEIDDDLLVLAGLK